MLFERLAKSPSPLPVMLIFCVAMLVLGVAVLLRQRESSSTASDKEKEVAVSNIPAKTQVPMMSIKEHLAAPCADFVLPPRPGIHRRL